MSDHFDTDRPTMPWSHVEYYLKEGLAATLRMSALEATRVDYVIFGQEIALQVELAPRQHPPRSTLPMIRIDQVLDDGRRMARIRTTDPALLRDFHDLLCAIASRIVDHGHPLDIAFAETVQAWSALISRTRSLDVEKSIGLLGELSVLRAASRDPAIGWDTAISAWAGSENEEHDFSLPDYDIEVKSTLSEYRRHVIHGIGQLTPKNGRDLWLVSLQFTGGGSSGHTLTECVEAVRATVRKSAPHRLALIDEHLARRGWSAAETDDRRWLLRSEPLVVPVDENLPRIDRSLLECLPEPHRTRIRDLCYSIDIDDFSVLHEPPHALIHILLPTVEHLVEE